MKKTFLKFSRILFIIMISGIMLFTDLSDVNAEPQQSITLGTAVPLPGYISGVRYNIKTVTGNEYNKYAYCTNIHKSVASNITANLVGTMDAGMAYILENGYPNKSFTGDGNKDFYITQGAVWWYLDDTAGTNNLGNGYKFSGSDNYDMRKYVKQLVDGAKQARTAGYYKPSIDLNISNNNMTLSKDKKYYVSNNINANAKNITDKYSVRLTSAPNGTIITDINGNKKTKFAASEKFKVMIPSTSVKEGTKVVVEVEAGGYRKFSKAYKYQSTNSSKQPVVILEPYTYVATDKIKLVATKEKKPTPTVKVVKIDKTTGNAVAGATLVIKNSKGSIVKEFKSSIKGNTFKDLPAGKYTLQETVAPAGYKLNSKPVAFTLPNDNSTQEVKLYNERTETGVIINKIDKVTGNNIAGATLVVKDVNKNIIQTFTSTINGYEIKDLANGTYTVEEIVAPAGYKLNSEPVSFTISNDHPSVSVSIYNEPISPIVTIDKVDSVTLKNIGGAEVLVTNSNGEEVARFTSTTDSYVLKDLAYGTYTVEEIKAPAGYFLNEEKQTFTIDANHLSAQVTIKDIPKTCENGGIDEDECSVDVPNTGTNPTILSLLGLAIISLGVGYVYKNNKKANK